MKIEEMKKLEAMRYWELGANASKEQKNKLKKEIQAGKYILTLKQDGAWYRFVKEESGSILQSRTISVKTKEPVEKQDRVPHIIKELDVLPTNTVLLGEIYYPNYTSKDITSIMGCLAPKAIQRQKDKKMRYYLFDLLMYDGIDFSSQPYEKRLKKLKKIEEQFGNFEWIDFVQPIYEDIEKTVEHYLEEGYEGAVLMHRDKPYTFGKPKRPAWTSVKYKQTLQDDIDLVIMGFSKPTKEYTGKYPENHLYWQNMKTNQLVEGKYHRNPGYYAVSTNFFHKMIGGFILGAYINDNLYEVARVSNLTDKIREEATKNPDEFLGQVVKVSAMSVDLEKRSLRHPKLMGFHGDKNPKECLYEEIFS